MAFCPHCGKPIDATATDAPASKSPVGGPAAGLGCGALVLIGALVYFLTGPGLDELKSQARQTNATVGRLRQASDAQTREIRELRRALEALRRASAPTSPAAAAPGK
ncbi:MAG: hypothetical protein U0835_03230 [Isosphaeraceae bacterium]